MKKIGLVGLGGFGKMHLQTLLSNVSDCRVVAVCDSRIESWDEAKEQCAHFEQFKDIVYFNSFNQMLDSDIDAVDIVSEEKTHFEFAKLALENGKHVFVEKPLSLSLVEAEELRTLAIKNSLILLVGVILRFDLRHVLLKERLVSGKLGEIKHIYCRRNFTKDGFNKYGRVHPFLTAAIHDIDLIVWLSQMNVKSVYAREQSFYGGKNPDAISAILELENGASAIIENVWHLPRLNPYGFEFQLEIICEKGTVKIGNQPDLQIWSSDNKVIHKELEFPLELAVENPELFFSSKFRGKIVGALREELVHFSQLMEKGAQSEIVPLHEMVYDIKLAESLIKSANTKTVVVINNEN